MFCPNCGKENPENATFCAGCGASLTVQQAANGQPMMQQPVMGAQPVQQPNNQFPNNNGQM